MSQLLPYFNQNALEAGCDEAGRGCLAGPVVAAAVILPHDFDHELLNDSKKMSEKSRMLLRDLIIKNAIAYGIGQTSVIEIDEINILNASFLAMHRAIEELSYQPELLLIDGNRFNAFHQIKHQCIIGGDGKYRSIAAASILAKTERDLIMSGLDKDFPHYNWKKNKGYPTQEHRNAIAAFGITDYHRKTFRMLK